jgi:hypothetical protein
LQRLELLDDLARQERAHDRQDLAELDVHAAQADEAFVHAARVAAMDLVPVRLRVEARFPQPRPGDMPDVAQEDDPKHSGRAD